MVDQRNQTTSPSTIFVDADIFIAWVKADDANHERAVGLYTEFCTRPVIFVTSNYVFAEAITVISQRVSQSVAFEFIDTMKSPITPFRIQWIDPLIEELAINKFKAQQSKNVSFVDCTNMALVDHNMIDFIFSFDGVYKRNGYRLVEFS